MSELTDLEICKRIAEIEKIGHQHIQYTDKPFIVSMATHSEYNPLTDDALCFQFCYKDDIRVSFTECPAGSGRAYWAVRGGLQTDYCDTPNRAVCMAKLKVFSND